MRKRDPVFPKKALEEDYENYQPATMVHIGPTPFPYSLFTPLFYVRDYTNSQIRH